jgi:signal peptidase I
LRRALYILFLAPIAYLVLQQPLALYTVVSGSMEPYVPRGSLVVVAPEQLGLGDVGAYRLEEGGKTYVIVHRVVGLGEGFYVFKGDAVDGVEKVPVDRVIGSVVLAIPYVGYVYMAGLANPLLVLLILLAAFLPSSKPSTLFPLTLATGVLAYLSPGRGLTAVINPLLYLMYSTAFSLFIYFVERREGPNRLIFMSYIALAVANAFSTNPRGVLSWIGLG